MRGAFLLVLLSVLIGCKVEPDLTGTTILEPDLASSNQSQSSVTASTGFGRELQNEIDLASQRYQQTGISQRVSIPSGVSEIRRKIRLRSGVRLIGLGSQSILRVAANRGLVTVIDLEGVENAVLAKFTLDGNVDESPSVANRHGIRMAATRNSVIRKVHFKNLGVPKHSEDGSRRYPGGSFVFVLAGDDTGSGIMRLSPESVGINSEGNIIENNVFQDDARASFGVRLLTNWKSVRSDSEFETFVTLNRIRGNTFLNGFNWNAIEVGGPATVENRVTGNTFVAVHQTAFEADKGAKRNFFAGNFVKSISPARGRHYVVPIRDQGYPANFKGAGNPARFAEGNTYQNNTVELVRGIVAREMSGVLMRDSIGATFRGNQFMKFEARRANSGEPTYVERDRIVEGESLRQNDFPD